MPEDQAELDQPGVLHAHCLQVSEEPNNVRRRLRAVALRVLCHAARGAHQIAAAPWPATPLGEVCRKAASGGRAVTPGSSTLCLTPAPPGVSCFPAPQQRPFAFSDPFIMRVGPEETVGQLRQRVQVRMARC